MDSRTVVNIGEQRFDRLREENRFYIDKTAFIKEWWDSGSTVTLITRPRRFGKTLNMSMVECFFSNKYAGRADLFEGLEVWKEERYRQLQGTYPVIFLSFAGIKSNDFKGMKAAFKKIISDEYLKHEEMFQSDILSDKERTYCDRIELDMDDDIAYSVINSLCIYLEKCYGRKTIILFDDYDTPMLEAWFGGYWDEVISFFWRFFDNTFKTNPHLYRGIITRISKESIFSDLNNLDVVTTISNEYANRESGYGRYDVMTEPLDKTKKAFIFEFKVLEADDDECMFEDTLANAHRQIEEKKYGAELVAEGFTPEQIRKYGFAFRKRNV